MMFMEKNAKKTVETSRLFFLYLLQNMLFQRLRRSCVFLYKENRPESERITAVYGENVRKDVFFVWKDGENETEHQKIFIPVQRATGKKNAVNCQSPLNPAGT